MALDLKKKFFKKVDLFFRDFEEKIIRCIIFFQCVLFSQVLLSINSFNWVSLLFLIFLYGQFFLIIQDSVDWLLKLCYLIVTVCISILFYHVPLTLFIEVLVLFFFTFCISTGDKFKSRFQFVSLIMRLACFFVLLFQLSSIVAFTDSSTLSNMEDVSLIKELSLLVGGGLSSKIAFCVDGPEVPESKESYCEKYLTPSVIKNADRAAESFTHTNELAQSIVKSEQAEAFRKEALEAVIESKNLFRLAKDEVKLSAKVRDDFAAMCLKFAALGFTIASSKYISTNIGLKSTLGKLAQHSGTVLVASASVTHVIENPDVFFPRSAIMTYLNHQYQTFGLENSPADSARVEVNNNTIFPQTKRGNSMDSWTKFPSLDQFKHAENVNNCIDDVNVLKKELFVAPKVEIIPAKDD